MNIHYGNHRNETSRTAVSSIHECHEGDFFTKKPLREVQKQEHLRTTKSATQNAQIMRVFFVLKAPREVLKQQQSIFNRSPYLKHSQRDIYYFIVFLEGTVTNLAI